MKGPAAMRASAEELIGADVQVVVDRPPHLGVAGGGAEGAAGRVGADLGVRGAALGEAEAEAGRAGTAALDQPPAGDAQAVAGLAVKEGHAGAAAADGP